MSEMVHRLGETLHLHRHKDEESGEHKQGLRDRIKGKIKEKMHMRSTDHKDEKKKKKKKKKNKKGGLFANNNENAEEEEEDGESGSSESDSSSEGEEEGGEEEEGGGGKWGKLAKATAELVGAVLAEE